MVQSQGFWARTKTGSKVGFDKLYAIVDKLGPPVNKLSNKLGSEAFWPTTLDKESEKAARILRSFCKDGFYTEEEGSSTDGPNAKQRVLKSIPTEVIKNAKGLAIFTTMRTGFWFSGAGGSGILIGRKDDGTWSPPSGIMLHTAGLGFLVGVDIYDCVLVINTQEALDAFSTIRSTIGGELSAVAGPIGVGGVLETEIHKRQAPIFNYLKSRGFYAGVQVDGTIIIERTDENERFYGERIGVRDILAGKVKHEPPEIRTLLETIKAAQGDSVIDTSLLSHGPPPGDYEIEHSTDGDTSEHHIFGVPAKEDPDPFGVLALEQAGLTIKEAGTHRRPTSEQFEFRPSPSSPIYTTFRKSMDRSSVGGASRRSSWRASTVHSAGAESKASTMVDIETQTDFETPLPSPRFPLEPPALPPRMAHMGSPKLMAEIPEEKGTDEVVVPEAQREEVKQLHPRNIDIHINTPAKEQDDTDSPMRTRSKENKTKQRPSTPTHTQRPEILSRPNSSKDSIPARPQTLERSQSFASVSTVDDEDDDEDCEEAIIEEVHQASAPQVISRARMVHVAKPMPPKLPIRSPLRTRRETPREDFFTSSPSRSGSKESKEVKETDVGEGVRLSPPRTPSLKNDGSSASSHDSISSIEDRVGGEKDQGDAVNVRVGAERKGSQASDTEDLQKGKGDEETLKRRETPATPSMPGANIPGSFD